MKIHKAVLWLLTFILLSNTLSLNVSYAEESEVKTWGDNARYVIDYDTATVTITGKGKLKNTDVSNLNSPFKNDTFIEKVVNRDGITSICLYDFNGCTNLKEVELPDSIEFIGRSAFNGTEIFKSQIKDNENTFITIDDWIVDFSKNSADITELVIPDGNIMRFP
ncbi:MAG: leucine-rich repeat protein [Ruminococcus sp.]|nr:leucine-rich repeat protein [Ruminococcus sp.]